MRFSFSRQMKCAGLIVCAISLVQGADYYYTRTLAQIPTPETVKISVESRSDTTIVSTYDKQAITKSLFKKPITPISCEVRTASTGNVSMTAAFDQTRTFINACGKTIKAKSNSFFNLGSLLWVFGVKHPTPGKQINFHIVNPNGELAFDARLLHKGPDTLTIGTKRIACTKYEMDLLGIAKFIWPYTYRYWYDAKKGNLIVYEGPDTLKRFERLVIQGEYN